MADLTLNIISNMSGATAQVNEFTNAMKRATSAVSSTGASVKKTGSAVSTAAAHVSKLGHSANKTAGFFGKLNRSLARIAVYRTMRKAISYVGEAFKKGLEAAYQFSKASQPAEYAKLAGAMDGLKKAASTMSLQLGAAFGGLITAVAPVLIQIINLVTAAADAITRFFAVLNGTGYYKKASEGFDDLGEHAGGAGKQIKGLLASWDELNVIGKESGGGGGGKSETDYSGAYEWVEAESDWANLFASGDFFGIGEKIGDAIGNIAQKFTEFLQKPEIQNFGKNLAEVLNGSVSNPENWENFGEAVGTAVSTLVKNIADFISTVNWDDVEAAIVASLDGFKQALFANVDFSDIGARLGEAINSVFSPDRFRSIGENIGGMINALFTTTYWTLNTTNFQNIGASVSELLNGAFSEIDFTKLGGIIANGLAALPRMIIGFINTMDWGLVGTAVGDTLKGAFQAASAYVQEIDWGELVINIITGILDFLAGLDIPGIAADILGFVGSVIGAVVQGLGTLLIDICDLLIDPNTWKLVGAWLQDLPKTLLSYGIRMANSIVEPIVNGINGLIEKYNGSGLAKILGTIEPINFQLIPEIPEDELHTHYKKAKEEIEASSKENPTVFDSTANWKNQKTDPKWAGTTWNSTANWKNQKTDPKWVGTTWNATANWKNQKTDSSWAGTTWNSTAKWTKQVVGSSWTTPKLDASANFSKYQVDNAIKGSNQPSINVTANITKWTGDKTVKVTAEAKANGGVYRNGGWRGITSYASGGSPFGGQIFRARENGNPELVGTIRGSTAVMNNGQIVASVSDGVARAIAGIHFKMVGYNGATINNAVLDDEQIARNIQDGIERGNEEQNNLIREQNAILLQLLRNGIPITPSVSLGQVMARSADLYARA